MKASTITRFDIRPAIALSFLTLVILSAYAGVADARGCRMTKPPSYNAMPPGAMPHPMYRGMRHPGGCFGCAKAGPTVVDVAKKTGDFATLLTAIDKAGLTALLEGEGPDTLFAPNEAAFADLPKGALDELLADKAKLTALLKYHLIPDRLTAADVLTKRTLTTASGQELATSDLSVVRADIRARNGVIHVVDKVLLPSG